MSTIAAGTTSTTALVSTGDTTGKLVLQTNGTTDAVTIDTSQRVIVGATSASAGGLLTLNRAPTAAFGSPMLQVGGASYTSGGYYSVGLGFTDATYTEPPAEIAYVPTSDSGGTKGSIVFGNRDVTTNTAVSERMRITSGGLVGVGTSSPTATLDTYIGTGLTTFGDFANSVRVQGGNDAGKYVPITFGGYGSYAPAAIAYLVTSGSGNTKGDLVFGTRDVTTDTRPTERMRITADANVRFPSSVTVYFSGATSASQVETGAVNGLFISGGGVTEVGRSTTAASNAFEFYNPNGYVGAIQTSGSSTAYLTSSDYRLKENVAPMTGALATVAQLNPVTYTWKADGSAGQGFIAHELQAVVPDCVAGEKDAVDAEGKPVYQGVDTSFLVATLTAAIQELKAITDAQAARIETLEAKVAALEAK